MTTTKFKTFQLLLKIPTLHCQLLLDTFFQDNKCFHWLIAAELYRDPNDNDISVSVCDWEPEKKIEDVRDEIGFAYTLRVAKEVKPRHKNLSMINDKIKHYSGTKNFSC